MSKPRHTPGPWKAYPCSRNTFGVKGNRPIVTSVWSLPKEEQLANTLLIAAAPEMLEALKSVTRYLPGIDLGDPVYERIAKLIAKAEGRNHE